jgi:hypothetical protein
MLRAVCGHHCAIAHPPNSPKAHHIIMTVLRVGSWELGVGSWELKSAKVVAFETDKQRNKQYHQCFLNDSY